MAKKANNAAPALVPGAGPAAAGMSPLALTIAPPFGSAEEQDAIVALLRSSGPLTDQKISEELDIPIGILAGQLRLLLVSRIDNLPGGKYMAR